MGLYLYCIHLNLKSEILNLKSVKGIDGSKVYTVSYKDIEAIVSEVDIKKFSSKEIEIKAKEDLKWITTHAQKHEDVIETAMGINKNLTAYSLRLTAVVPMKFGTIFKAKKNLETVLKKDYQHFKKILKNLDKKQEWGVKIYVKKSEFKKILSSKKISNEDDYFAELEKDKKVEQKVQEETIRKAEIFFTTLKKLSEKSVKNRILSKWITAKKESMILNGAFLVKDTQVKSFLKKVEELRGKNQAFIIEYTGPWPAYNFVQP